MGDMPIARASTSRRAGRGRGARPAGLGRGGVLGDVLAQPILQRVEGDDEEAPAGREHALGGGEGLGQLTQLVVDVDAQRLERARRRVPAADLLATQYARDEA